MPDRESTTYWDHLLDRLATLAEDDPDRESLRSEVIEGYLPMADRLARRYSHRGERLDDLIQVARLGLIKAVDGFDPQLGSFPGYAIPTIRGELKRYFRDQCWDIKVPRRLQELRIEVNANVDQLSQQLHHMPSASEVASEVAQPRPQVELALDLGNAYSAASLNAPATNTSGESCELVELLGGTDPAVDQVPDRVSLAPALSRLPQRERDLLVMRFFDNLTQAQIAERLGLSQMHVSRLLTRTLGALRDWIDGNAADVAVCAQRRQYGEEQATPADATPVGRPAPAEGTAPAERPERRELPERTTRTTRRHRRHEAA